jgi:UDP-N-acetyl-D-galactosamine dehydrogenase
VDIVHELHEFNINVDVYDLHANKIEVYHEYGIKLIDKITKKYSAIVLAVAHNEFKLLNFDEIKVKNGVLFDSKSFIKRELVDSRL